MCVAKIKNTVHCTGQGMGNRPSHSLSLASSATSASSLRTPRIKSDACAVDSALTHLAVSTQAMGQGTHCPTVYAGRSQPQGKKYGPSF